MFQRLAFATPDSMANEVRSMVPAVELHMQQFGHAPEPMTTDAGFFSAASEAAARELGVKRTSMPN